MKLLFKAAFLLSPYVNICSTHRVLDQYEHNCGTGDQRGKSKARGALIMMMTDVVQEERQRIQDLHLDQPLEVSQQKYLVSRKGFISQLLSQRRTIIQYILHVVYLKSA